MNKKVWMTLVAMLFLFTFTIARASEIEPIGDYVQRLYQKVSITNWPDFFKTREQNIDINGNIKVHEQETVEIIGNVAVNNLPSIQDVKITNTDLQVSVIPSENPIVNFWQDANGLEHGATSQVVNTNGFSVITFDIFGANSPCNSETKIRIETSFDQVHWITHQSSFGVSPYDLDSNRKREDIIAPYYRLKYEKKDPLCTEGGEIQSLQGYLMK